MEDYLNEGSEAYRSSQQTEIKYDTTSSNNSGLID